MKRLERVEKEVDTKYEQVKDMARL